MLKIRNFLFVLSTLLVFIFSLYNVSSLFHGDFTVNVGNSSYVNIGNNTVINVTNSSENSGSTSIGSSGGGSSGGGSGVTSGFSTGGYICNGSNPCLSPTNPDGYYCGTWKDSCGNLWTCSGNIPAGDQCLNGQLATNNGTIVNLASQITNDSLNKSLELQNSSTKNSNFLTGQVIDSLTSPAGVSVLGFLVFGMIVILVVLSRTKFKTK